jgi:hypothetical protein
MSCVVMCGSCFELACRLHTLWLCHTGLGKLLLAALWPCGLLSQDRTSNLG